jgi:thiol:disulfide interchange protein DsbD
MGMGLPLLIIGTSAGSLLPKAGDWMITIKIIFGVLMLALAIWMLERILPSAVIMLLWGMLFIGIAVFIGGFNTLHIDSDGWEKLRKTLGILALLYGSLLVVGAASGSQNLLQPLDKLSSGVNTNAVSSEHVDFTPISNLTELNNHLASYQGTTVLDLYADWCVECKRMEATTFKDPQVIATLATLATLQLDMTENTSEHKALLKSFNLFGPPTLLFFDSTGQEYRQHRLIGMVEADQLLQHLKQLPKLAQ